MRKNNYTPFGLVEFLVCAAMISVLMLTMLKVCLNVKKIVTHTQCEYNATTLQQMEELERWLNQEEH